MNVSTVSVKSAIRHLCYSSFQVVFHEYTHVPKAWHQNF